MLARAQVPTTIFSILPAPKMIDICTTHRELSGRADMRVQAKLLRCQQFRDFGFDRFSPDAISLGAEVK
jgi:hypothetical protein